MTQSQSTPAFGPDFVLDLNDPAFIKDPYPTYRWLRESAPAYVWPGRDAVVFSRYRDVKALLNDRRVTNDMRDWEHARKEEWAPEHDAYRAVIDNGLFRVSEKDHARVRKLISVALTPRSVERMRGEIQRAVDSVLAAAIQGDRLNVRAYAEPLPLQVIGDMLKIPEALRPEFRAFGMASIRAFDPTLSPEVFAETIAGMPRWVAMLRGVIADRRKAPLPEDLLSMLIAARDGAAALSEDELISLVHALLTAGSDTTVHALCFAIYNLLRHPDQRKELRDNPSLLRNAIDETLRFDIFGKGGIPRVCREDMSLGGVELRRGQMVYPFIPAALHDPEVFPEPERFDIRRDLSQSIAFGSGQHFCLGAALARMELEIATSTLLGRFPDMKLIEGPVFEPNPVMRSMTHLLVQLH